MLWTAGEALTDIHREHIDESDTLNLSRDERQHVMHFRFRSMGEALELHRGYLGQIKDFTSDSLGIVKATRKVFTQFCTKYANPPRNARFVEQFMEDKFRHLCNITEAISIDSAENEVCASNDTRWDPVDASGALTPNCKFLLRDAAHSARRVLGRLFSADPVMDGVLGIFGRWSDSLPQLIHNSKNLQKI